MFKKLLFVTVAIGLIGLTAWRVFASREQSNMNGNNTSSQNQTTEEQKAEAFDKSLHSTEEPDSIWVVTNKKRALPDGYTPANLVVPNVPLRLGASAEQMHLRQDAATALESMVTAAKKAGYDLYLASGYRSYAYQKVLYDGYVARDGQAEADKYSARPGTSEHQTGLAADVGRTDGNCELEICFGDTAEGKWVAANAHKYGFIIRYLEGKESVTTYQYEPWHLRFVGKELATELKRTGQTMEEFFNL